MTKPPSASHCVSGLPPEQHALLASAPRALVAPSKTAPFVSFGSRRVGLSQLYTCPPTSAPQCLCQSPSPSWPAVQEKRIYRPSNYPMCVSAETREITTQDAWLHPATSSAHTKLYTESGTYTRHPRPGRPPNPNAIFSA